MVSIFVLCKPRKLPLKLNEQGKLLKAAIEAGANAIINIKDKLNEWDSAVGDGDCGSTVSSSLNGPLI